MSNKVLLKKITFADQSFTKIITNMATGLQHIHSFFAYLVLVVLFVCVVNAVMGYMSRRKYSDRDRKINLIGLIVSHIQLLFGMFLYFTSPKGFSNFSGDHMKDAVARLYMLEHPLINIIALVLITIGYSKSKKILEDSKSFKTIYLFYGIGLLLILSRIPWTTWLKL